MIKQIFVVGRNRSGTKWLSNLIANSSDVTVVQNDVDGGIVETNLFANYPKHFDLSNQESKAAFEILFKHSNFFKSIKTDWSVVEPSHYEDYYDFFKQFMDTYAKNEGCSYWLQKESSSELSNLMASFPDAKFIIIQRDDISSHILSYILKDKQRVKVRDILFHALGYWRYRKNENTFLKNENVQLVNYEALKQDASLVLRDVCSFVGLTYSDDMLHISFPRNTSYKKGDKKDYLTSKNIRKIKFISSLVSMVPLFVLNSFSALFQKFYKQQMFVPGTFSLYRNSVD